MYIDRASRVEYECHDNHKRVTEIVSSEIYPTSPYGHDLGRQII